METKVEGVLGLEGQGGRRERAEGEVRGGRSDGPLGREEGDRDQGTARGNGEEEQAALLLLLLPLLQELSRRLSLSLLVD